MKFGEQLKDQKIQEWSDKYLDYDELKKVVETIDFARQQINRTHEASMMAPVAAEEQLIDRLIVQFWELILQQMLNIDEFFIDMYTKFKQDVDTLEYIKQNIPLLKGNLAQQRSHVIENCQELYKGIAMLQDFAQTNMTGLSKITKKLDKVLKTDVARKKIIDMSGQRQFANSKLISDLQLTVEISLGAILQIQQRMARKLLFNTVIGDGNNHKKEAQVSILTGILFGLSVMVFASFVNVSIWYYLNLYDIFEGITKIQQVSMRLAFTVVYLIMGLGFIIHQFQKRKINYIFIFELPRAKITASYRTVYAIGCLLLLTNSFIGLMSMGSIMRVDHTDGDDDIDLDEVIPLPISFGDYLSVFAKYFPPGYWCSLFIIPISCFLIRILIRVTQDRAKIGRYLLTVFYKMLTPWKHRVAFQLFFGADILTSLTGSIKDILYIMGLGYIPEVVVFVFINIPNFIRLTQCVLRVQETKLFYPHGFNFIKYLISIPGTLIIIQFFRDNKAAFHCSQSVRLVECLYKLYWDYFEDWAFFYGGTGAKQFRKEKSKWAYKFTVRRPTFFNFYTIWFVITFNFVARLYWVVNWLMPFDFSKSFSYTTMTIFIELTRRFVWALFRLDNQQTTNCENYLAIRQIPILIEKQEEKPETRDRSQTFMVIAKQMDQQINSQTGSVNLHSITASLDNSRIASLVALNIQEGLKARHLQPAKDDENSGDLK